MVNLLCLDEVLKNIQYPINSISMLDSAINRANWDFDNPTFEERACKILMGIIRNHPFVDGNKRASLLITDAYLRLNNYRLGVEDKEDFDTIAYDLVLGIAEKNVSSNETNAIFSKLVIPYNGNQVFGFASDYPDLIKKLSCT
jgi:prophage maintenance system killer protein